MTDDRLRNLVRQWRDAPDDGPARGEFLEAVRAALDADAPDAPRTDPLAGALEQADPDAPDLAGTLRAALAPAPAPVVMAAAALELKAPDAVVSADAPAPDNAAVASVGEVGVLAAPGGSGKSYLALHLALMAVSGQAPARACGLTVRPGPVLMVSYEDSPARVGARLRALRARDDAPEDADLAALALVDDPGALWRPAAPAGAGAVRTDAFGALRRRADTLKPSLIVIDPVSAAGAGLNLNEGGAARACMRDLAALSTDTGAGVLLVAHDTKAARNEVRAGGTPGAGAVAGSAQWFDAARGVVYLTRTLTGRTLECLKANHGRAGWGVALCEVGGAGNAPFRGFGRAAGGGWIGDMEAHRQEQAKAAKAARKGKDAPKANDGEAQSICDD